MVILRVFFPALVPGKTRLDAGRKNQEGACGVEEHGHEIKHQGKVVQR